MAAGWSVSIGMVTLTTITLVGWVAAPRAAIGPGLPGVFRAAINLWLVAHQTGFALPGGRVGLLPLGLVLLPGALLFRAGGWITRAASVPGLRRVGVTHAALSLAVPYAIVSAALALLGGTSVIRPSVWEAVITGFLLALAAGGLGSARELVTSAGGRMSWAGLLRLLPERPRALVVGVTGATLTLVAAGAVLVGGSLVAHLPEAERLQDSLAPGLVGGVLLFLLEVVFLPNAIIWGMSYAIGPGFAVGSGTTVSPSGITLGELPAFPLLAALPESGPAPLISLLALAAPFAAGVVGGVLTVRTVPTLVPEAAPLWGFASGVLTGGVMAGMALLSSGPLGGGRLTAMGPSAWQVGVMAALEVGLAAAIAAWAANWRMARELPPLPDDVDAPEPAPIPDQMEFVSPDPVLANSPPRRGRSGRSSGPSRPRTGTRAEEPAIADEGDGPDAEAGRPQGGPSADTGKRGGAGTPAAGRSSGDAARTDESASGGTAAKAARDASPAEDDEAPSSSPPAREGGGKVETRGGAIFVLKDDTERRD